MRKLFGCLSLLASALLGLCLGLYLASPKPIQFIDEKEARALAVDVARYQCKRYYEKRVDCIRLYINEIQEQKEGWLVDVVSKDRRRYFFMWINRAGYYETRGHDDLDKGPREFGFSGRSVPYFDLNEIAINEM